MTLPTGGGGGGGGGGKETETVTEGLLQQRGRVGAMPVTYGAVMGRCYVCYL